MNIYQRIVLLLGIVAIIFAFFTAPRVVIAQGTILKQSDDTLKLFPVIEIRSYLVRTISIIVVTVLAFYLFSMRKNVRIIKTRYSKMIQEDELKKFHIYSDEEIDRMINFFSIKANNDPVTDKCLIGMNVIFTITKDMCFLDLNLDNFDKTKVLELLRQGKLREEKSLLSNLAALPYAEAFTMNDGSSEFVDRIRINLANAFNPLDRNQYKIKKLYYPNYFFTQINT